MPSPPLLSVIIPVYNVEPYLDRCLESVIRQTYRNLDIILVDDGSTDAGGSICDEYQKKDRRIQVVHQENRGLSEARNTGLALAKGALLAFVDSDDWLDTDAYTLAVKTHLDTAADISVFGYYRAYAGKKACRIKKAAFFDQSLTLEKKDALHELILNDRINNYVWNKIFTRSIFDGVFFPPGSLYEDIYIMHKLFLKAEKISVLAAYTYYYFTRGDSIANSKKLCSELKRFDAYCRRYQDLENNPLVSQETLTAKTATNIIDLFYMFPFQIKGEYKEKMNGFLRQHRKALQQYPLQIRDRLFLALPFTLFLVVYNPAASAAYRGFKRLLSNCRSYQ